MQCTPIVTQRSSTGTTGRTTTYNIGTLANLIALSVVSVSQTTKQSNATSSTKHTYQLRFTHSLVRRSRQNTSKIPSITSERVTTVLALMSPDVRNTDRE